jgi:methylphosphotriester-DNA--protein-cysteine methyltransferase
MKTLANLAVAAMLLMGSFMTMSQSAVAGEQPKSTYAYEASALREPFHRPSCRWAAQISPRNLQTFKTRQEAINAGHRPCKVCKP